MSRLKCDESDCVSGGRSEASESENDENLSGVRELAKEGVQPALNKICGERT